MCRRFDSGPVHCLFSSDSRRRRIAAVAGVVLLAAYGSAASHAEPRYGEPVTLKGRHVSFTSWQYVRQGRFAWQIERDSSATDAAQNVGSWLEGDGSRPARFEPIDMPRGVRLVAQPPAKRPFPPGRLAATLFDEGTYKAWYTVSPPSDPEPASSKHRILPGHALCVAYAESTDGENWVRPTLGLVEYAGNRDNNIVFRGDLAGSARGWIGGCVFLDPSSEDERFKMLYLGLCSDEEWAAFEARYPGEADSMARRPCLASVEPGISAGKV